jgi:hypothetical protein
MRERSVGTADPEGKFTMSAEFCRESEGGGVARIYYLRLIIPWEPSDRIVRAVEWNIPWKFDNS